MNKIVKEIVELLKIDNKADKAFWEGLIGVLLSTVISVIYVLGVEKLTDLLNSTSTIIQEVSLLLLGILSLSWVIWWTCYLIRCFALIFITIIKYGIRPLLGKNEASIEAQMSSKVEDKRRLRKAIKRYLTEHSAVKYFAAVYIWMIDNNLLKQDEQKLFLDSLSVDFPKKGKGGRRKNKEVCLPSENGLSNEKKNLLNDNKREYLNQGFKYIFEEQFGVFLKENAEKE